MRRGSSLPFQRSCCSHRLVVFSSRSPSDALKLKVRPPPLPAPSPIYDAWERCLARSPRLHLWRQGGGGGGTVPTPALLPVGVFCASHRFWESPGSLGCCCRRLVLVQLLLLTWSFHSCWVVVATVGPQPVKSKGGELRRLSLSKRSAVLSLLVAYSHQGTPVRS